jgi:hypothetical protein
MLARNEEGWAKEMGATTTQSSSQQTNKQNMLDDLT